MSRLIFDIETNGLLDALTKVHCIVLKDADTGEAVGYADQPGHRPLSEALARMETADMLIGHNVIGFDLPALNKVYPDWSPRGVIRDTMIYARLVWPSDVIKERDFKRHKDGKLPGNLIGSFSLQAFGYRMGNYKGDYDGGWETWNKDMQSYMMQDGEVTYDLWRKLEAAEWPEQSVELEHRVATIVSRQERHGFLFDQEKAGKLYADMTAIKLDLEAKLQQAFPPWTIESVFVPKANNSKMGYRKGEPFIKRKIVEFNPASRDHIASRLKAQRGWHPTEFTPDGRPKVDDAVLEGLEWPEAKLLLTYLTIEKRIGQLATGKEAWLKRVGKDGRLHGRVITNGANTGRMTHSGPNMSQVPGVRKGKDDEVLWGLDGFFGAECRDLFTVPKGKRLVGADAAALELRCLAGYMAVYDGGDYIKTVLEGRKEDGTEIHSVNAKALGCSRSDAKVWFYAFIYGAGDMKLGSILGAPPGKEISFGRRSRARFLKALPALGKIIEKVKDRAEGKAKDANGKPLPTHLTGLDGRRLRCRSSHSAFNTLLQSAGAVIMKVALVTLDDALQASGMIPGKHYEFVANVHDEWQIEVDEDKAEYVATEAVEAIRRAGSILRFRCPIDGEAKVGGSWFSTH